MKTNKIPSSNAGRVLALKAARCASILSTFILLGCEIQGEEPAVVPKSGPFTIPEISRVEPGMLLADSVKRYSADSVTLSGRFIPHGHLDRQIKIAEVGYEVRYNDGREVLIVIARNFEWTFNKADTIIRLRVNARRPEGYNGWMKYALYMVVENNLPGPHEHEAYEYRSYVTYWSLRRGRLEE